MKPQTMKPRLVSLAIALVALAGLWFSGQGLWIHAKALLAQQLLEQAWTRTLESGDPQAPWPWADTWPVARLRVPARDIDLIVLAGDSGRTLAFGPGHTSGSALPGQPGTALISGHRDTHFRFLRDLAIGDEILIDTRNGRHRYRIDGRHIIDQGQLRVDDRGEHLILVTCYPFDALVPGGPLRYVVEASRMAPPPGA
jgi:sortase A